MVGLGSGEEFGVHCMIFGVCYSVSDSEDRDTSVVASESTSKADGRGDLCSGETDADLGGSRMTLTFCMPLLWAAARSLASSPVSGLQLCSVQLWHVIELGLCLFLLCCAS